ncbi:MAG TPA: PSD1 and planctomycete cytochrome C domain-containing protein [Verrucomicrobiales bacterium]|nr:PSD1 and planctomycete cytochrome C domain-containing protein [Verrucomicrobiales bacterium]
MRKSRRIPVLFPATVFCGAALLSLAPGHAGAAPDFTREVRPILEKNCYGCHGPDKQKSGYRLDVRAVALKGGDSRHAAIVPHNSGASPLYKYVSGADAKITMPPKTSTGPRPTAEEIETLRAWIDAGPSWPDEFAGKQEEAAPQWALQPLVKPAVPGPDPNPIDAFIRAKLSAKNLGLSPEADPGSLIRRVYADLIGLPPSPEETEAFVKAMDRSNPASQPEDAWSRLVDTLLSSPRYGERWARHWLDTIHFADSHGFEHDVGRENAWPFRDYVISALNEDKPWRRFVKEQLAADYFYPNQPQLTPALGYLGAGTFDLSAYSTAPVMFEYIDRDDMVTQTMSAFVSTTANCARCHAHKFDPISQEDYYALQAVFAGLIKGDISYDANPDTFRERQRWTSILAAAEKKDSSVLLSPENASLVSTWISQQSGVARWQPLEVEKLLSAGNAVLSTSPGVATAEAKDKVYFSTGPRPDKDTYTITGTSILPEITAIRLNVLADASLPKGGPGRQDNGNLHLSEFEARLIESDAAEPRTLKFSGATADFNQEGWGIQRALDGKIETAWGIHPAEGQSHYAVFTLAEKLSLKQGARLEISLKQAHGTGHLIGAFNLAVTGDPADRVAALPVAVDAALAAPAAERTQAQQVVIAAAALHQAAGDALKKLPPASVVYAAAPSVRIPSSEGGEYQNKSMAEPPPVRLLHRGEYDKPRDVTPPGALSALKHLPARFPLRNPKNEAERRAALADWIAHPDNILTWRSIVNRVWHYHFGRGLCDTPSDFGRMGDIPANPELIDWLAVWFRDEAKGSLKQLHRLIVTSAVYRQSSAYNEAAAKIDGDNRLLWRQNNRRLDADTYRDFALAVSGKLDLTMGGPPVQQFKRSKGPQATPALDYSYYDWNSPGAGRRSIYRCVWRGIADPFMEALDFPDLGLLAPVRGFSASSLQALTLYNNNFVLQQSESFAKRTEKDSPSLEEQVTRAVRLAWLRTPKATEQKEFTDFAKTHGLAALCRLLLNSDEFLFVN